eukprot:scaffold173200_cov26-Tisochrysis_lutea.AAC.1
MQSRGLRSMAIALLVGSAAGLRTPGAWVTAAPSATRGRPLQAAEAPQSVSVGDLGLTMDEVNERFPEEMLQGMVSSGYESTSRLPDGTDEGAAWFESAERVEVTLTIPGLRGQPAASLAVEATENTLTITAWGRAIWSCVLRSNIDPNSATMSAEDGMGMQPIIKFAASKEVPGRWGGFIQNIGEDSLL